MGTERPLIVLGVGVVLAASVAGPVLAAERPPLSAIDWLSNSVSLPKEQKVVPQHRTPVNMPPAINVAPLDGPLADRAGTIAPSRLGVPTTLWGRSAAADLAERLADLPDASTAPPSLRAFLHDLLMAQLDPPIDASEDDSFYLARLDWLLQNGRLSSAEDLVEQVADPEPRSFRRAFDIALLTGTETEACKVIEDTPEISPTYPARVFCLARLGNWDVAAITLGNAEALGILTPDEDALLLHFLDPELFEGEPIPDPPRLPSPLIFRLYEALGERIPTDQLPIAFAFADLDDTVGWKTRLRAVERLVSADAVPFERLLSVYSERQPAASGRSWERVAEVNALLKAVERGDTDAIGAALPDAWSAAKEAGYQTSMARWIADRLGTGDFKPQSTHIAFEIALLAGRTDLARRFVTDREVDQFLLSIARGDGVTAPSGDFLGQSVIRGLSAVGPGAHYKALIDDGRPGEALLSAMSALMNEAAGNPDRTANALALLKNFGLEALARQVSVELLLEDGAA